MVATKYLSKMAFPGLLLLLIVLACLPSLCTEPREVNIVPLQLARLKLNGTPSFALLRNRTFVIFDVDDLQKLREILSGRRESIQDTFQIVSLPDANASIRKLTVRKTPQSVAFDNIDIEQSELDRLHLSQAWSEVLDWAGRRSGIIRGSAITRISKNLFLVSGGKADDERQSSVRVLESAILYELGKGVLATIPLRQCWREHVGLRLPDGRVVLAGGGFSNDLEIVDPIKKISSVMKGLKVARTELTGCTDSEGRCFFVGGEKTGVKLHDLETVDVFDYRSNTMQSKLSLRHPRHFRPRTGYSVENAACMGADTLIVVGGESWGALNYNGFAEQKMAEVITISSQKR